MAEATDKDEYLRFRTAGYSVEDRLSVSPGPCKCGEIEDGVAFWHDRNGAWVIAYDDLLAIVAAATATRGKRSGEPVSAGAVDPAEGIVTK